MAGRIWLRWIWVGLVAVLSVGTVGAQLYVGPGGYATIQAAINAAAPGDTIVVVAGVYNENVTVNKTVNLVGAPGAVLQGSGGNGFLIQAPNVSIQGFEVKGYAIGVRTYGGPSNFGDLLLKEMYVHSNTQNGILIVHDTFSTVTVDGCVIANNNQNGIGVANAAVIGALNILDSAISGNKSSGLYVASTGTTINGGLIQDTAFFGNTYQGLFVENGPVVSSLSIVGGAFSGNQLGLHTRNATINDLVVRGVQISGNKGSGMAIAGTVNGLLVEGCTFQNNPWEHLDLGLWTYSAILNNVVIRGNTFGDGSWYSIYIFAPVLFSTGGLIVTQNAFLKPWSWGVYNNTGNLVLAYNNWWGSATGPNVVAYASANVVYSPWLGTSTSAPTWTFIVDDRGPIGPAGYLQPALDGARNGDTILVKAGEYVTQGIVGKSVRIVGETGAVIKSPGSQTYTIAESSAVFDPVIFAYGGTLAGTHVSGPEISFTDVLFLTVDGQNVVPPGGSRLVGILYRNVHGTISGNTIRDLMPGGSGSAAQTFGILVYGDSVVDIIGNVISNYSRGGIGVNGDVVGWARGPAPDPVANIVGNVVTGNGLEAATGWWAENGIQIGYGATGQIVGNVVSNHWVNNPSWAASGILVVGSDDVSVLDNLVFNNETSIAVMGLTAWGGGPANDNLIAGNTVLDSDWGIGLQYDALNTTIERNVLSGNYVAVSSWGWGSVVPGGTLVRFNSIAGNTWGLVNYESQVLDAALNWWGSALGPSEFGGSNPGGDGDRIYGNVIYSPWLGTDPDGDPTQPGVQITGPVTIIVAPVGPEPTGGYLNTAIAGANTLPFADTIRVRAGTYDVSTPVTGPTSIFSCSTCPNPATLTGTLSLQAAGILIGRMGEGFTILGDITVGAGVDASTIHINWNDIYGDVTNSGLGVLDATYNWWGGRNPGAATFGRVNYYPYLPRPVCEVLEFMSSQGLDANAAIFLLSRGGLLSEGLLILDLMARYGLSREEAETLLNEFGFLAVTHALGFAFDYDDFVRLLLGYGAAPAGGAGSFVDLGIAGGAGAFQGQLVDAIYEAGQPIFVSFELQDFQGNPVTAVGGWVTLIQLHENGHQTIWYWGPTRYNPVTGLQEISIPTRPDGGVPIWYPAGGLPAGYYKLIIALRDASHQEVLVEIVNE